VTALEAVLDPEEHGPGYTAREVEHFWRTVQVIREKLETATEHAMER
jgi:hypothetical protein